MKPASIKKQRKTKETLEPKGKNTQRKAKAKKKDIGVWKDLSKEYQRVLRGRIKRAL